MEEQGSREEWVGTKVESGKWNIMEGCVHMIRPAVSGGWQVTKLEFLPPTETGRQ